MHTSMLLKAICGFPPPPTSTVFEKLMSPMSFISSTMDFWMAVGRFYTYAYVWKMKAIHGPQNSYN